MEVVFIMVFAVALFGASSALTPPSLRAKIVGIVLASYFLRLAIHLFVSRSLSFFSHGVAGGDCLLYEQYASAIVRIWALDGVHFVTSEAYPVLGEMGQTGLVCNLYALIIWMCGAASPLACTSLVAFIACMTCLLIFRFAKTVGASDNAAFLAFAVTIFGPSFIYHTSDMYKDGLNAFLVVLAVYLAVDLAKNFSIAKLLLLVPTLWALWNVRPYMVFMCLVPLPVGFLGARREFSVRTVLMGMLLVVSLLLAVAYGASRTVVTNASAQFELATDANSRDWNASTGGSGVTFDDGGNPLGQIHLKLLYTVFSPFPWMGGSMGLQLGKLDAFIWYWVLLCAWRGTKIMWRTDRSTLVMLLLFIIPGTVAYAATMANVGLILRQRMPIMMVATILATIYWASREGARHIDTPAPAFRPRRRPTALEIGPHPADASSTVLSR